MFLAVRSISFYHWFIRDHLGHLSILPLEKVRHDVHRHGEDYRRVLLRRDRVQRLQVPQLHDIKEKKENRITLLHWYRIGRPPYYYYYYYRWDRSDIGCFPFEKLLMLYTRKYRKYLYQFPVIPEEQTDSRLWPRQPLVAPWRPSVRLRQQLPKNDKNVEKLFFIRRPRQKESYFCSGLSSSLSLRCHSSLELHREPHVFAVMSILIRQLSNYGSN